MEFYENIKLMKRILRQGWVRAGVPLSSIESLADHSWSVAVFAYMFSVTENQLRGAIKPQLNTEKAVLIGLFHDLVESEYFDADKSIEKVINHERLKQFKQELVEGAIQNILEKFPNQMRESISSILNDFTSEESQIVRVSDLIDLLFQAKEYKKKNWLDENQFDSFYSNAFQELIQYKKQFLFLENYIQNFIEK